MNVLTEQLTFSNASSCLLCAPIVSSSEGARVAIYEGVVK